MSNSPARVETIHERDNLLPSLWREGVESNSSIALWRLPNQTARHLLLSERLSRIQTVPLEELPTGFIFSPFNRADDKLFMEATYKFSFDPGLAAATGPLESRSQEWLKRKTRLEGKTLQMRYHLSPQHTALQCAEAEEFQKLVLQALDEIHSGQLEKVVGSRVKQIELTEAFDIILAFNVLCKAYPDAFVSLVSIPGTGTWLGASPEILVSIQDSRNFLTSALAGTQPFKSGDDLKDIAWRQKEIEEQALVSRYIINCFKKIRLREYEEHGPRTVIAGNLLHLNTEYKVDMEAVNFPQLGSVMLELLHPTSAVCGMPFEAALDFIKRNEPFDRAFYTGYLGPVNSDRNTNLFVNLRCMQLLGNKALLYAGAGITEDSDPVREWNETEMKMNTLLNVLQY